jgi:hypothetical protein
VTEVVKTEKGLALKDHEIANRAAPGGRLPVKGAKSTADRSAPWTQIGDGSPAAIAAAQEEKRGLSQKDFSAHLSEYVRRSRAPAHASAAAPAPAPAASGVPANWDKLSTREQMHHALQQSAAKRRGS